MRGGSPPPLPERRTRCHADGGCVCVMRARVYLLPARVAVPARSDAAVCDRCGTVTSPPIGIR